MSRPNQGKPLHTSATGSATQGSEIQGSTTQAEEVSKSHRHRRRQKPAQRPAGPASSETTVQGRVVSGNIGRDLAQARQSVPQPQAQRATLKAKQVVKAHISNLPARTARQSPAQQPVQRVQQQRRPVPPPPPHHAPSFTLPQEFDSKFANGQLLELLKVAPSAFPDQDGPFLTAYARTLTEQDPRQHIYPPLLENPSRFTKECIDSWQESLPPADVQETISRIIWNVNEVIASRWPRMTFVVEPFGSVSWRGQTGSSGDLDLVLRDYSRPLGYTEDYWGQGGASNMKLPSVYNMNVVARTLRDNGFVEVEPIKWATTPITKFKDPFSGFEVDLNVNDLGGLYNSAMINAYCRLSPYQLRPLIHIVKSWAKARDLNNPSGRTGQRSLSSYCWALMAIGYMQIEHGLPNLQDDRFIRREQRQDIDVWVGWGRAKGIPAHVSFADSLAPEDCSSSSKMAAVEWQGHEFVHSQTSIGDLVKGFFKFFEELTSEATTTTSGETHKTHCLSVWKGGLVERGFPMDLRYDSRQQEYKRQKDLPAAAQQVDGVDGSRNYSTSNNRSRPVSGFAQPQEWSGADLVVQDPFLHDKNCASAMNRETFTRLQAEFARGSTLTSNSATLEMLLETCDPVEHTTRAQRRATERAAKTGQEEGMQNSPNGPVTSRQRRAAERLARIEKEKSNIVNAENTTHTLTETTSTKTDSVELGTDPHSGRQHDQDTTTRRHDASLAAALAGLAVVGIESEDEDLSKAVPKEATVTGPKSLGSVDTVYSADSIEWSPFDSEVFVCGTYQIEQLKGEKPENKEDESEAEGDSPAIKRHGRALVYRVADEGRSFKEIQRFEGPAILDMKWSHPGAPGGSRLAISNAEGQITVHNWDQDQSILTPRETVQVDEASVLCLSLDWSNQLDPANSTSIISSLSNGNLAHIVTDDDGSMTVDHTWQAHDYEPWITAWDLWQTDTVWSGGDDLKLKRWDIRDPMMPTLVNKRFEGGVTTIASSPHVENMLAVGSYDSNLRIFDARNARIPLQTIPVGGGVWRTKWHPSVDRKGDILLACMHGGFRVIKLDRPESWLTTEIETPPRGWEQTALFEKHESIAYGVDWQRGKIPANGNNSLIASCSFYDHLMHLWRA